MKKKKLEKLKLRNVKLSPRDERLLQAKAKKHADGNLSAWLRHAGMRYTPKKSERVVTKYTKTVRAA